MSFGTIVDKKALADRLPSFILDFVTTVKTSFDKPIPSDDELSEFAECLAKYLGLCVNNKIRKSTSPLNPDKLFTQVMRTRDPKEEYRDSAGRYIKGKKDWYYIVLLERIEDDDGVFTGNEILAESTWRKDKAELYEAFVEVIRAKVKGSEEQDKALTTKFASARGHKMWREKGEQIMKKRNETLDAKKDKALGGVAGAEEEYVGKGKGKAKMQESGASPKSQKKVSFDDEMVLSEEEED